MKRNIIKISEEKCNGCGLCIPNCPEGAIQIIDGKARLISDLFCDGLGACLGHCPENAITIEEREAVPYNEKIVMANIVKQGPNVIKAHLHHLNEHNETHLLAEATAFLKENNIKNPLSHACACPGARAMDLSDSNDTTTREDGKRKSYLTHWPIQLHLMSPTSGHYQGKDVLLSADCVAYTLADFHKDYLNGKSLAIACPKLDDGHDIYVQKIIELIDEAKINTLSVMIMEVPCCRGLLHLAEKATKSANRKIPIKAITVSLKGHILNETW